MGFLSKVFKKAKKAFKTSKVGKELSRANRKGLVKPAIDFLSSTKKIVSGEKAEEANKAAEARALAESKAAESRARTSEVFAQTEGRGQGTLGNIQLGFDDEDEEELMLRQGKSSLQL